MNFLTRILGISSTEQLEKRVRVLEKQIEKLQDSTIIVQEKLQDSPIIVQEKLPQSIGTVKQSFFTMRNNA